MTTQLGAESTAGTRRRFLIAGTAGGVGATTVSALLFAAVREEGQGAPALLDHTAGSLGARLADGDEVRALDDRRLVHDLGPLAATVGVAELADPAVVLIVVSAATRLGCRLAAETVRAVGAAHGPGGLSRTVVVLAGVFGRVSVARESAGLQATGVHAVLMLAPDPALAVGGRIPAGRLGRRSRGFGPELVDALHAGRRAAGTTAPSPGLPPDEGPGAASSGGSGRAPG